ncbi:probable calcium-binding protein CML31 [Phoenix dactylifera]|uniref:Probable calcium-binding protein CML31 n=1 Tax=Phoenix dactylifera TaxID=42345 RepID=A0A8B8ZCX0_PHODC|nr:probable calcium-binding protein CML31 [Phoenix dactylifera]
MKSEAGASTSSTAPQKKERSFLGWLSCILWPPKKEQPEKAKPIGPPKASRMLLAGPSTPPLQRLFRYFDGNGDGKISPAELQSCMRTIGEELSPEDAAALVESTDSDGDGLLAFDEFVELVTPEGEEEKGRNLREAFRVYEMDDQECITPTSLKRALGNLGVCKTIEDCTIMIRQFDINGDGVISFDEFRIMML